MTRSPRWNPHDGWVPHAGCQVSGTTRAARGHRCRERRLRGAGLDVDERQAIGPRGAGRIGRAQHPPRNQRGHGMDQRALTEQVRTGTGTADEVGKDGLGATCPLQQVGRLGHGPDHIEHGRQRRRDDRERREGDAGGDQQFEKRDAVGARASDAPDGRTCAIVMAPPSPTDTAGSRHGRRDRQSTGRAARSRPRVAGTPLRRSRRCPSGGRSGLPGGACAPDASHAPCSSSQSTHGVVGTCNGASPVGPRPGPPGVNTSASSRRERSSAITPDGSVACVSDCKCCEALARQVRGHEIRARGGRARYRSRHQGQDAGQHRREQGRGNHGLEQGRPACATRRHRHALRQWQAMGQSRSVHIDADSRDRCRGDRYSGDVDARRRLQLLRGVLRRRRSRRSGDALDVHEVQHAVDVAVRSRAAARRSRERLRPALRDPPARHRDARRPAGIPAPRHGATRCHRGSRAPAPPPIPAVRASAAPHRWRRAGCRRGRGRRARAAGSRPPGAGTPRGPRSAPAARVPGRACA